MEGLEMYVSERAFARHLKGSGSNHQQLSPQRNTEKPTYLYIVNDYSFQRKVIIYKLCILKLEPL